MVPTNNYFVYPFLDMVVSEITISLIFTQNLETWYRLSVALTVVNCCCFMAIPFTTNVSDRYVTTEYLGLAVYMLRQDKLSSVKFVLERYIW